MYPKVLTTGLFMLFINDFESDVERKTHDLLSKAIPIFLMLIFSKSSPPFSLPTDTISSSPFS